jgi:hypothetical protein
MSSRECISNAADDAMISAQQYQNSHCPFGFPVLYLLMYLETLVRM